MTKTTIQFYNEQDFLAVKSKLSEREIPFFEMVYSESSFPVASQFKMYGELIIEGHFQNEILNEFKDRIKVNIQEKNISKANTKKDIFKYSLIGYSILVTLFMIKFWYQNSRNSGDKNYIYEWNYDGTVFSMKDRKNGKDVYRYIDRNYNLNFEEVVSFSKDGNFITNSFDENEDGIFELSIVRTSDFNAIAEYSDQNNIGFHSRIVLILENQDTLVLKDENENGLYEIE